MTERRALIKQFHLVILFQVLIFYSIQFNLFKTEHQDTHFIKLNAWCYLWVGTEQQTFTTTKLFKNLHIILSWPSINIVVACITILLVKNNIKHSKKITSSYLPGGWVGPYLQIAGYLIIIIFSQYNLFSSLNPWKV